LALTAIYAPPAQAGWRARYAHRALRLAGWQVRFDGSLPAPRGVIIAYPHTSNWDFFIGLATIWALALPIRWIGKETLFTGWFGRIVGPLLRRWGGRPVFRQRPTGMVEQLAQTIAAEPWCWIALSPEGTRRRLDHWRSGFYHLALRAQVPVGLAFFDFVRREVGICGYVELTGDVEADMARIAAGYAGRHGRFPALESQVRLDAEASRAK
jgi:1-acyl-sn-glycerol-3-phosphate acyltransferase